MIAALICLAQTGATVNTLDDYLKLDTGKPSWTLGPKSEKFAELRLNSLVWQGDQWRHEIIIAGSDIKSDVVILNLTGDRMENTMDDFTTLFSKTTQLPVATVYGIPNQPSFGLREDELVGRGFMKFITTQDNTWPLLLPMTKSTLQAMDAVQEWSHGRVKKFILTGTSKRGATSWLAATTGDPRIVGIAPMVSDVMMDITRQLEAGRTEWGHFSPMMPELQTFDPIPFFKGPRGRQLMNLSDPYFSLSKVKAPALVISASNDQFCVVDATRMYWDAIKSPKVFKTIPNATHFFAIPNALHEGYSRAMSIDAMNAVRFFADCISGKDRLGLPDVSRGSDPRHLGQKTWSVSSDTPWVQESQWNNGKPSDAAKFSASFEEARYRGKGYSATFTSLVSVRKR